VSLYPASAQRHAVACSPRLKYTRSQSSMMAVPTPTPLHSAARPRPIGVSPTPSRRRSRRRPWRGSIITTRCSVTARAPPRATSRPQLAAIAHTSQDRIDFYDRRVVETVTRLERDFGCDRIDEARWEQVKRDTSGS